jgi:hypothetical protein
VQHALRIWDMFLKTALQTLPVNDTALILFAWFLFLKKQQNKGRSFQIGFVTLGAINFYQNHYHESF